MQLTIPEFEIIFFTVFVEGKKRKTSPLKVPIHILFESSSYNTEGDFI